MPFQPVEDCLQLTVNGHIGSIPFVNLYHFVFTGTLDETGANAIAEFVRDAWTGNMLPAITTSYEVSDIVVTDLRTESGPQFVYTDTEGMTGTGEDQKLPYQVSALITWNTAIRGRSYRGRTYLGGFTEGGSDGRSISSTTVGQINGFATDLMALDNLGVVSRMHANEPRDPAIITPITSATVHTTWRTQRRRALASD